MKIQSQNPTLILSTDRAISCKFNNQRAYKKSICFGSNLMRLFPYRYIEDDKKDSTWKLKINEDFPITIYPASTDSSVRWIDANWQQFTKQEMVYYLNHFKQLVNFDYYFTHYKQSIIVTLQFYQASRAQTLLILNIVRRFWRFDLALTLKATKILYEKYKHKYNLTFLEYLIITETINPMSDMGDDLLAPRRSAQSSQQFKTFANKVTKEDLQQRRQLLETLMEHYPLESCDPENTLVTGTSSWKTPKIIQNKVYTTDEFAMYQLLEIVNATTKELEILEKLNKI